MLREGTVTDVEEHCETAGLMAGSPTDARHLAAHASGEAQNRALWYLFCSEFRL